eukprot:193695_1
MLLGQRAVIRNRTILSIHIDKHSVTSLLHNRTLFSSNLERWKGIYGFSRYEVSSCGNVRNCKFNKLLTINTERAKLLNIRPYVRIKSDATGKWTYFAISRLVLTCFDPKDDVNNLFAIHIDGDKYYNHLSNLEWGETMCKRRYKGPTTGTQIKLRNMTSGSYLNFDSVTLGCKYLLSLNINTSIMQVSRWCYRKKVIHGYQFEFVDETKYNMTIPDLHTEEWKLFDTTPVYNVKCYISSCGRAKRVYQNGKEALYKPWCVNGYFWLNDSKRRVPTRSRSIARLVALHFVHNPNNFMFIDHIDANPKNNHKSNLRWIKDQKENSNNPITRQRCSEAKQIKKKVE